MSGAALGGAQLSRASEWRRDSVRVNAIGPLVPVIRDRHHPSPVWVTRSGGSGIQSATLRRAGGNKSANHQYEDDYVRTAARRLIARRTLNVGWEEERSAFAEPRPPLP